MAKNKILIIVSGIIYNIIALYAIVSLGFIYYWFLVGGSVLLYFEGLPITNEYAGTLNPTIIILSLSMQIATLIYINYVNIKKLRAK